METPKAPLKAAPEPVPYTDLILRATILYSADGIVTSEQFLNWGTKGARVRSYQIPLRQYLTPNGAVTDLLRSHDALVRPALLRQPKRPARRLSEAGYIIDAPVQIAGYRLPFAVAGGPGSVKLSRTTNAASYENQAQSILELFVSRPGPNRVDAGNVTIKWPGVKWDLELVDSIHRASHPIQRDAPSCYLEPVWPGPGWPASAAEFEQRMEARADLLGWGSRSLFCDTVSKPAELQRVSARILDSPEDAVAARERGVKVHCSLSPAVTDGGLPLLDVDGSPLKLRQETPDAEGESMQVEDNLWERYQLAQAVRSMSRILQ